MSNKKSTNAKRAGVTALPSDPQSIVTFIELVKLRSLAPSTQVEYLRYVRKLGSRLQCDPATLDEPQVRAYLLRLKQEHSYSSSSMRSAVAALSAFYNLHLDRGWALFSLVRTRDPQRLPVVLSRVQVAALINAVRTDRFAMILRVIYACGLRVSEALRLEVRDIRRDGPSIHVREAKGNKERLVPLPNGTYRALQLFWKTHRHPRFLFPSVGRGWKENPNLAERLGKAEHPIRVGAVQTCVRNARAVAGLSEEVCVHTLRHSYATHLLEEGVSIRLISAFLGHSSLETTLIYTHLTAVNEASARAALERLEPPVT